MCKAAHIYFSLLQCAVGALQVLTWSKRRSGRLIKNICTDILEVSLLTVPVHSVYAPTLGARSIEGRCMYYYIPQGNSGK